MPLLKKFGSSKNSSRNNNGKVKENSEVINKNNRSNGSHYAQLHEIKTNSTRGPTIIRPGASSNLKKKAPPRPPPPKTTPPSYEEVLKSDMSAFIGRPTPNIPSAPRPPVPNHRRLPPPVLRPTERPSFRRQAESLIDFDSTPPPPPPRPMTSISSNASAKATTTQNLLDLDDIFSCNDFPTSANVKQSSTAADTKTTIMTNGNSRGDDWLQTCLSDAKWDSSEWDDGDNASQPPPTSPPPVPLDMEAPPLPPRPKTLNITKPHAVALFDYTAQQTDELNFKINETIMLVHQVNNDWYYGYTDRSAGLFPISFVQILVPLPESSKITSGPRCRATYDYTSDNDGDLNFRAGDVIVLKSKDQVGWYKGTLNSQTGMFPANFVEVIEDLPQNSQMEMTAIALYDFIGEKGELTFKEGQRLIVCGSENEDWLTGRLENSSYQGRFPNAFVQMLN